MPTPATKKKKAQHNFWPVEQEEEAAAADEVAAKTGQTKGTRRAPENVDSPAWSPMGRRQAARQAGRQAGEAVQAGQVQVQAVFYATQDDDGDKATKTSRAGRKQEAGRGAAAGRGQTRGQSRLKSSPRRLVCAALYHMRTSFAAGRGRRLDELDENLVAHFGNCALKCLRRDKINVGCSRGWS